MLYKIIGDSCTDITREMKQDGWISLVPLTLEAAGKPFSDDDTFCQKEFLAAMEESEECPKSACPSPERYMKEFEEADENYVVTLSSALSGSYNSAMLAKSMYLEEHPEKKIEVVDSHSASVGQTLIAMKIRELKELGFSFEEVKVRIEKFRNGLHTKFVLESLENLRKNGRLTNLTAMICNALNIKPVMGGTAGGTIEKLDQARGMSRALNRMIELMERDVTDAAHRIIGVAHCNNRERAEYVRHEILKRIPFRDCIIVDTAGVSSLYANNGGIIVAY